jgi:CDP-diacylglycerol--glycerol-3-phosphate 3-phosphatidyltransferase
MPNHFCGAEQGRNSGRQVVAINSHQDDKGFRLPLSPGWSYSYNPRNVTQAALQTADPRMFRHIPNLLTASRLLLAIVFFVMLSFYQYEGRGDVPHRWLLHWAFLVYLIALITDFLDGYLARKWKIESGFGRVVDPFVDKVLVLGSFIFFAGKNFIISHAMNLTASHPGQAGYVVKTISGVAPGMVVILLARELLITSIRGASEGSGKNFGAAFSGKVKMVFQSATILTILLYVNYYDWIQNHIQAGATAFRDFCIWGTVVITVVSGLMYVRRAILMYRTAGPYV